jgi:SynChlorMet cassette radical SAM/SPASM protein ScmE
MSEIKVMSVPRHVDIAITGKCNLTCQYCFYADEMVARTNLPTERWLSFFDELGRLGVMTVCLTGGEVFTRPDLFELIDGVIANRMRYQLLTNGTLITERTLKNFEVGKRRSRLDSIQVSIDGSTAEIHDRSRPNSFNRAVRGLKLLLQAGFPVTVRVTINRFNVDNLEEVAHLLLDEIGLHGFSTNEAFPCGATNRIEHGVTLDLEQKHKAMQVLSELSEQYKGRIQANAGPLSAARELETIKVAISEGKTGLPGRGKLCSCNGVYRQLAILHDGTIVPCHMLSTLHMGMIGVDDLQTAWLEHPHINAVRQRNEIPLSSLDTCQGCQYQGFCGGGCPGGAIFNADNLFGRDPVSCLRVLMGEDPFFKIESRRESEKPN